jgi:4a-hydroxytetrahydrobiopterin dehydratase
MMPPLLSPDDRKAQLSPLADTGWAAVPGKDALRKVWKFRSFQEAWGFMSRAALVAEKLNHHPDWTNRYNVVDVTLTTHSAKGLTQLDVDLAQAMDRMAPDADIERNHGEPVSCLCELHSRKA